MMETRVSIAQRERTTESGEGVESADDPGPRCSRRTLSTTVTSTSGGSDIRVDVIDRSDRLGGDRATWIGDRLGEALAHLGTRGEVRVLLVDDAAMARAHEERCGAAGTTDVITFDLGEGGAERGEPLDVDLLVCVDEAVRQGEARGLDVQREILLYALHGVLHCLGYDDHDDAAAARMHGREDEVLEAIGVGPTFASGAGDPGSESR